MGQSLGRPASVPAASFTHAGSNTRFRVRWEDGVFKQTIERDGIRAEHSVAFVIGSGNHARGYIIQTGDRLWQSPVAFYPRRGQWDMAPGYESNPSPDFNRPITAECLLCHSGKATPLPGFENRYAQPPFLAESITCDRCHGAPDAHLRSPSRTNIVNPKRLAPAERDSVCEQCHLNGESRVLNPGAAFDSFRPGSRLEDVFSVFVFDRAPAEERGELKVVSHAEQLALSQCARRSGSLWCGSCHSVHGEAVDYPARCRACHANDRLPGSHLKMPGSCTECHMPKRPAVDGAHTAFTDHRIRVTPAKLSSETKKPLLLRPWRHASDPALRQRNLGLACIATGERDGDTSQVNRGYGLLAEVFPNYPNDAEVLSALGMVLFLKDQPADAVKLLQEAVRQRPNYAPGYEKLGVVLRAQGEQAKAKAAFEKAIELDETREPPYHLLAEMSGTADERRRILDRYLQVMPGSLIARRAVRTLTGP
jgi:hypothetical protein